VGLPFVRWAPFKTRQLKTTHEVRCSSWSTRCLTRTCRPMVVVALLMGGCVHLNLHVSSFGPSGFCSTRGSYNASFQRKAQTDTHMPHTHGPQNIILISLFACTHKNKAMPVPTQWDLHKTPLSPRTSARAPATAQKRGRPKRPTYPHTKSAAPPTAASAWSASTSSTPSQDRRAPSCTQTPGRARSSSTRPRRRTAAQPALPAHPYQRHSSASRTRARREQNKNRTAAQQQHVVHDQLQVHDGDAPDAFTSILIGCEDEHEVTEEESQPNTHQPTITQFF